MANENRCIALNIAMGIISPAGKGILGTVEYRYDGVTNKEHRKELENVTPKNVLNVAKAIGKRRLAKENELVGYPISVQSVFETGQFIGEEL